MTDHPDRVIHGRIAHYSSVRHERMRVVSQVTNGAVVSANVPATPDVPATLILVGTSPSVPVYGPSLSVIVERPTSSTTASRRPRDDAEGSSVLSTELREDDPVPDHVWYREGPIDVSLVTGKGVRGAPNESWFWGALIASGLRDLCTVDFKKIHNGMQMKYAERWHPKTSSFHLPHGEINITLDDIACFLHLSIRGTLLSHGRLTKEEAKVMLIEELGVDLDDALEEVEITRGADVRFHTLQRIYDVEILAALEAVSDEAEANIHKEWVLRCYLLYLIGTQLFVDMSSTYKDVVYLTYLSDIARVREHNWGADTLAYTYHRLGEGYPWKARTVAGNYTLLVGEVSGYTEDIPCARAFAPLRGNQVPDPYRRCLDRMATEDIHFDYYGDHHETVPFDEIALYSRWLASSSTIILDEVFADWEHHMVLAEARETTSEKDLSCVEGYITWYYRISHTYMLPTAPGSPSRPAHKEILQT
ncbi:uncharacterized protein LOC131614782 [Vicia villosa]|uniref:uncharacterized protein LOC131614782 n=1 Tax=Vicia villosa TaxID=3911 RepID=UPI00273C2034|nr:uncharacterized protein LOC131614782 [Vicia villosa]